MQFDAVQACSGPLRSDACSTFAPHPSVKELACCEHQVQGQERGGHRSVERSPVLHGIPNQPGEHACFAPGGTQPGGVPLPALRVAAGSYAGRQAVSNGLGMPARRSRACIPSNRSSQAGTNR